VVNIPLFCDILPLVKMNACWYLMAYHNKYNVIYMVYHINIWRLKKMFPGFVLSLREGLEAALVIGIALGVLRKMQRADLYPAIWWGAASAALVSLLAAGLLTWIGAKFEGRAEELFEGTAMLLAAGLLTWMIFWMQRQSSRLRGKIEADVHRAVSQSGGRAMFAASWQWPWGLELALFLVVRSAWWLPVILGAAGWAAPGLDVATTRRLNLKLLPGHQYPVAVRRWW
jgi:high-affinity iron transporter